MLKTIHKSIMKELFLTFLLTLAFLNSILMMEKLLRLSRLLSGVGASLFDMAKIILYLQPQLLLLTVPMSLLLSTLLVYGRMNSDSEIVVLKASGMPFSQISLPVMVLGIFCFLTSIAASFYLGPKSSIMLRENITEIIAKRSTLSVEEGTFNMSFKDIVLIVKGKKSSDTMETIFIYDNRKKDEPKVLMAKEGRLYLKEGLTIGLFLKDGYIHIAKGRTTTDLFFENYNMTLNLEADSPVPKRAEFSPLELLEKIQGPDTPKKKTALYLELHRRFSLPVVCIILVFLGTPLSFMAGKSGRLGGLALGLMVFTVYYMLLLYGENLVSAERIPHYIGAWISTAVISTFSILLYWKENKG